MAYTIQTKSKQEASEWKVVHSPQGREAAQRSFNKAVRQHRFGGVVQLLDPKGEILEQFTGTADGKGITVAQPTLF